MTNLEIPSNGERVILSHKTQHGASIIREHGKVWTVLEYRPKVLAFSGKPGILVSSVVTQNWCWVRISNDKDFYWAEVKSR